MNDEARTREILRKPSGGGQNLCQVALTVHDVRT